MGSYRILIKRDLERQLIIGVVTLLFRPISFSFKNMWENRQKTFFSSLKNLFFNLRESLYPVLVVCIFLPVRPALFLVLQDHEGHQGGPAQCVAVDVEGRQLGDGLENGVRRLITKKSLFKNTHPVTWYAPSVVMASSESGAVLTVVVLQYNSKISIFAFF